MKTLKGRKISHVHGLEELILSKCPIFPNQCADSMIASKYQWHALQKKKS
jgi:hypothetical protein